MEKTLSTRMIFEGRAIKLRIDTVITEDKRQTTREVVEHTPCIAVVPIDADNNILLVKQFRQAIGKELLEIPAGGIEPGEDPAAAVARELREETGFLPKNIKPLGGFYAAPGYATEYLYLFIASDLIPMPLVAEDTAEIKVVPVAKDRIPGLIAQGDIQDSKSIAGLLRYLYLE
ncbi:MAG: NUDIX hydrolase [Dehalococcoidales bacterium]|nr:NUDIX hydrolase [Dehalococcoidales bacterium]